MLANHNNIQTKCTQNNQHINNNIIASNDLKRTLTKCSLHREKKFVILTMKSMFYVSSCGLPFAISFYFHLPVMFIERVLMLEILWFFFSLAYFALFFLVFFHIFVFLFVFIIVVLFLLFREMLKRIYANLHFNVGKRRDKK